MADIYVTNQAKKALKGMQAKDYERIQALFQMMRLVPVPAKEYDISKVGGFEDTYRVRIGRWRIIYELNSSEQIITVLKIEMKKDSTYRRI